jgi:hypothetical protein
VDKRLSEIGVQEIRLRRLFLGTDNPARCKAEAAEGVFALVQIYSSAG